MRCAISVAFTLSLLGVLMLWDPGRLTPVPGAQIVAHGTLCETPDPAAPCEGSEVSLPYFGPLPDAAGDVARFEFTLDPAIAAQAEPGAPLALFFPLFADALFAWVNDTAVLRTEPDDGPYWHWNRPAHVRVPAPLVEGGAARLTVQVHSAPRFPVVLRPFQFGPDLAMHDAYLSRIALTREVARIGLLLAMICTGLMTVLAVARRRDKVYHWAAIGGFCAAVISAHHAVAEPPLPADLWQATWASSVPLLVAALHRFIRRFLRRRPDWLEHVTLIFAGLSAALLYALAILAPEGLLVASAVIHVMVLAIALYLLTTFLRDRRLTTPGRFVTLYGAMTLTAAFALHDAIYFYIHPTPVTMPLGQFMPMVFMFVTAWLVVMQLVRSLRRQETLAGLLRDRVIRRSRALRRTADALEAREREMLVEAERQRIMMELHDGVGGHLVNALAGLRQSDTETTHLRDILEEAQTDLGLMVDSLYNPGDVAALLAALRARLEPALERQGIRFDWQVEEEPQLPAVGPSGNIDLVRIVQEFVTNTLKHSGARCITVQTGTRHLCLMDDGRGLPAEPNRRRGHGLTSMRRRAERIGARLTLTGSPRGTVLQLEW